MAVVILSSDIAPSGSMQKFAGNGNISFPSGNYLPENIVFDSVSQLWWSPLTDGAAGSVALAKSPNLIDWTIDSSNVISGGSSPHLLQSGGTWYMYYGKVVGGVHQIYYATCATVNGTYTVFEASPLVAPGTGWESTRVLEPFVFQDTNGTWVMFYMGDTSASGSPTPHEQIGYATASSPTGPFSKYAGNPVIPAGSGGQFDSGGTADPWVLKFNSTYYVGYTYSGGTTTVQPWQTALVTTPDLVTFTKQGAILTNGSSGAIDSTGAFRGALVKNGGLYYLLYAAGNDASSFTGAMATLPSATFGLVH